MFSFSPGSLVTKIIYLVLHPEHQTSFYFFDHSILYYIFSFFFIMLKRVIEVKLIPCFRFKMLLPILKQGRRNSVRKQHYKINP